MSQVDALALLDIEGSEGFVLPGAEDLIPATDLPYHVVARCCDDDDVFIRAVAGSRPMPRRDIAKVRSFWVLQQGLLSGDDLGRLQWVASTFRKELEIDLLQRLGLRLGDLWRERQWRLLLNLIDHLPRTTWTQSAMINHPEYAEHVSKHVAKRNLERDPDEFTPDSLVDFTPEAALLMGVIDAVNALRHTLMVVNTPAGKQVPQIPPYPRPRTLVDTMVAKQERMMRWSAHERLTERLLPHRKS